MPEPQHVDAGAARAVRLVGAADGRPLAGAQLLPASSSFAVPEPQRILGTADGDGIVRLDGIDAANAIAWSPSTVPVALDLAAMRGTCEVRLEPAHDLRVHCIDENGAPVGGCTVLATAERIVLTPGTEPRPGFANPALANGAACAITDARGIARLRVLPFAPLYLRALHHAMLPDDPLLLDAAPLAAGEGEVVLHLRRASVAVAMLPDGMASRAWAFAVPADIDRSLQRSANDIGRELRRRFPGCGVEVWRHRTAPPTATIAVSALADDGSLWSGTATWSPIDRIGAPAVLQPATIPTGWLRVDLLAGPDLLPGIGLMLVGPSRTTWTIPSNQPVQLPVGSYSLSLALPLPRLDEAVERRGLEVLPGDRAHAQVVRADLGTSLGWIRLQLRTEDGLGDPHAGVSLNLESGDGFTIVDLAAGERILVPQGRHELLVGQYGYAPWQRTVHVQAGQVLDVAVQLQAKRR